MATGGVLAELLFIVACFGEFLVEGKTYVKLAVGLQYDIARLVDRCIYVPSTIHILYTSSEYSDEYSNCVYVVNYTCACNISIKFKRISNHIQVWWTYSE